MKKVLLITALVVVVVIIALFVICYTQKDKLVEVGLEKAVESLEMVLLTHLPPSITPDSAKTIIRNYFNTIKQGTVAKHDIEPIMQSFQTGFADQVLDSAEVAGILRQMEQTVKSRNPGGGL
ncbi:MAG: hypothetical protein KBA26_15315 [Candidatus Delongbacteria bacterium]|nr:hypothetical protein [Candidatus Delongbacteria bacterium]